MAQAYLPRKREVDVVNVNIPVISLEAEVIQCLLYGAADALWLVLEAAEGRVRATASGQL